VKMTFTAKKGTPSKVICHELILPQLILSLIENSVTSFIVNFLQIKFTKSGTVSLTITLKKSSKLLEHHQHLPESHYVIFKVKDSGIGIDGNQIPNLFTPFFQVTRDDSSSGLSLCMSYSLIN
jgi:signal transduction histidine kinase